MVICSTSKLISHGRIDDTSSYLKKPGNASKQAAARHISTNELPPTVGDGRLARECTHDNEFTASSTADFDPFVSPRCCK